jgi:hypothetical protein
MRFKRAIQLNKKVLVQARHLKELTKLEVIQLTTFKLFTKADEMNEIQAASTRRLMNSPNIM